MRSIKYLMTSLLTLIAVFTLTACTGNAQSTGEKIDDIAADVGNAVEDACENVKETLKAKHTDC